MAQAKPLAQQSNESTMLDLQQITRPQAVIFPDYNVNGFDRHNVDVIEDIRQYVIDLLSRRLPASEVKELIRNRAVDKIVRRIDQDLDALVARDPATGNDRMATWHSYLCIKAVANYRIAHFLWNFRPYNNGGFTQYQIIARQISEWTKVMSGVEIHPAAIIGRFFTIDHGMNTVIGETTVIGDHAYILNCVTLGGTKIAGNLASQRHPILGNNVQVGAFARIYGAITVGDNVVICPHAVITEDIPADSRVIVRTTNQIVKKQSS